MPPASLRPAAPNDPTTAVQVVDQLEDTLTLLGRTPGLDPHYLALREAVLPEYAPSVERGLRRLDEAVAETFAGADLEAASMPDRQGIGGATALQSPAA